MRKGFFIYSDSEKHAKKCVERSLAKEEISRNENIQIDTVNRYYQNGVVSVENLVQAIDRSSYVCLDLTGMGHELLFSLGYAAAKRKELFLLRDTISGHDVNLDRELIFLKSILKTTPLYDYSGEKEFFKKFKRYKPWIERRDRAGNLIQIKSLSSRDKKVVLYLKSHINTEISKKSQEIIEEIKFPYTIDDPSESSIPSMKWYVDRIVETVGVFVELSSQEDRASQLHNAKCFFVSGMALGLNRRLLMISDDSFSSPLVSIKLFAKIGNLNNFSKTVEPYINFVRVDLPYFLIEDQRNNLTSNAGDFQEKVETQAGQNKLSKVAFGSFLAENEGQDLNLEGYYSDVWNVEELISTPSNLFVGRKGVGKTATLKAIKRFLSSKEKTHVCVIEPLNEEMQGLDLPLKSLSKGQRTHIIQNVWKSLIYTQIVISLNTILQRKDLSAYSESEIELSDFVSDNEDIFYESLSHRLRGIKDRLGMYSEEGVDVIFDSPSDSKRFYDSVSESLHLDIIKEINKQLVKFLYHQKIKKIVVLIDNLDKAWEQSNSSYEIQSLWINELINVSSVIVRDLSRVNFRLRSDISFSLFIFLRSDIFYHVRKYNSEPDKIRFVKLAWDTQDKLFRVIDKRISFLNMNSQITSNKFWNEFVTNSVNGISTKSFIYERIIPRPRDLIYFLTEARDQAVYREENNKKIAEQDILEAYKDYSFWLFQFLKAESTVQLAKLQGDSESFMDFLVRIGMHSENSIVSREVISKCAREAFFPLNDADVDDLIDHLVSISILGLETSQDNFEYVYEFDEKRRMQVLSERIGSERYRIHNAIVPFVRSDDSLTLEIIQQDSDFREGESIKEDLVDRLKQAVSFYLNLGQTMSYLLHALLIILVSFIAIYQNRGLLNPLINVIVRPESEEVQNTSE